MVDLFGDALAGGALVVSVIIGWLTWGQLRVQRDGITEQQKALKATLDQIQVDEQKVETLGKLVSSLHGIVETQRTQVEALGQQVRIASEALKLQQQTLEFEKQRAAAEADSRQRQIALDAAKLQWDQTPPHVRAKLAVDALAADVADSVRRGWRRLLGRR